MAARSRRETLTKREAYLNRAADRRKLVRNENLEDRNAYEPTPEEIAAACAELRRGGDAGAEPSLAGLRRVTIFGETGYRF